MYDYLKQFRQFAVILKQEQNHIGHSQVQRQDCFFWQDVNMSNDKYKEDFEASAEATKNNRGTMGYKKGCIMEKVKSITADPDCSTSDKPKGTEMIVRNNMLASWFL